MKRRRRSVRKRNRQRIVAHMRRLRRLRKERRLNTSLTILDAVCAQTRWHRSRAGSRKNKPTA
jgi:hypothetical protein